MPLDTLENLLGMLVKASRILIYDLPLSCKECLSWIYCPEITPESSCKKFLKKWIQERKTTHYPLTQHFYLRCPSPPVLNNLPDIVFWNTFYQLSLYNLLRLPSSVGILTLQNFFAALSDSKSSPSSSFCYAYSVLCNFFTPLKYLFLIYSGYGPVSNHCCLLNC